jgi:hypothetical protein
MVNMVQWIHAIILCIGLVNSIALNAQEANTAVIQEVAPAPQEAPAQQAQPTPPVLQEAAPVAEPTPTADAPTAAPAEGFTVTETVTEVTEAPQEQPAPEVTPTPVDQPQAEQPTVQEVSAVPEEPTQPEIVQPELPQEPQPELGPDEIMGIDTVDLESPQGNWLYKRVWWEKAEKLYEKIRNTVNKIMEMRTGFFAKRADLDKTVLDPFYIKIGLSQGELQEVLSELIGRLGKEKNGKQDEDMQEALEQAETDKQELERLQKDVELVVKQDSEVEDAIIMLVDQINKIRRFEQEAWQNFKAIARVLDDKKARELFYKVDNAWRNIQEMQNYIDQTYTSSFDQLVERIKEKIQKIDSTILSLKEKGVDLKQRILRQEQMEEEEEEAEQAPKGFFTRYIIDPVKNVFQSIWAVMRWPIDKIMGRTAPVEEDELGQDAEIIEETEVEQPEIEAEEQTPVQPSAPRSIAAPLIQPAEEDIDFDVETATPSEDAEEASTQETPLIDDDEAEPATAVVDTDEPVEDQLDVTIEETQE